MTAGRPESAASARTCLACDSSARRSRWRRLGHGLARRRGQGTRSYCNWDEDSLTMAVEAARDCLTGIAAPSIGALTFASTTHPFADRSNGGVVATALNLDESVRVADAAGHQRAGVGALFAGLTQARDDIDSGRPADRRLAKPASEQEVLFGHGAAALLVGRARMSPPNCSPAPRCRTTSSTTTAAATRASTTRSKSAGCATRAT